MPDLRPGFRVRTSGRRFRHLTPSYLYWRTRLAVDRLRHPQRPSLTRQATRLLTQLIRPGDIGAEWGAGNSTGWFAERFAHLTSFESSPNYYPVVQENLRQRGLGNVDLQLIETEWVRDEDLLHESDLLVRARAIPDESLDYALVDMAPRSCLCAAVIGKLKPGGILVLDNANRYIPPPVDLRPSPVSSVVSPLGFPGSGMPENRCMPAFLSATSAWRRIWTTDGVSSTLLFFKP